MPEEKYYKYEKRKKNRYIENKSFFNRTLQSLLFYFGFGLTKLSKNIEDKLFNKELAVRHVKNELKNFKNYKKYKSAEFHTSRLNKTLYIVYVQLSYKGFTENLKIYVSFKNKKVSLLLKS